MNTTLGEQLPGIAPEDSGSAPSKNSGTPLPGAVLRIPVSVQIVIGTAHVPLAQVAQLVPGAMLTLDERLGTPARMLVNGREVARGDLLVVDESDGRLGFAITEIAGKEHQR